MTPDPPMRLLPAFLTLALAAPAAAQTAEDGFKAYDAGDYKTAKAILLPLAEAGDPRAMNRIGRMHKQGNEFPADPVLACDWYEKAAELGYVGGQNNLAICYQKGIGRNTDIDKAIFWTERAAEQGSVDNQVELIRLYFDRDRGKAKYWGQKAANAGSITARFLMDEYKITYSGPRPTRFEKYCYILMIGILKKPRDYCDRPNSSPAFQPLP